VYELELIIILMPRVPCCCRESNVTLGLGLNRVLVFVVDSVSAGDDVDERRVLNVYTLTIYRQARLSPPYNRHDIAAVPSPPTYEACGLLQVGHNIIDFHFTDGHLAECIHCVRDVVYHRHRHQSSGFFSVA